MDREFVELRSVCRTWGASLLRRMPSGLARPVLGGWGHANDREIRDHGGSSTRPPLPLSGSTVCLPRPGWVAPMRLPRPSGRSTLYPGGGVARLRSVRPVSGPRLVRVLPPVVGFPPPPVGAGGGGGLQVSLLCEHPKGVAVRACQHALHRLLSHTPHDVSLSKRWITCIAHHMPCSDSHVRSCLRQWLQKYAVWHEHRYASWHIPHEDGHTDWCADSSIWAE